MSKFMFTGKGIEIYTWEHCPYCQRAKHILNGDPGEASLEDGEYIEYTEHKIDGLAEERADMAKHCEGHVTVPQVLIDGKRVGGCFDLVGLVQSKTFRQVFANYIKKK